MISLKDLINITEVLNEDIDRNCGSVTVHNKIFGVFHKYDIPGALKAIPQKELICIFETLEKAEEFKKKYEDPHVYCIQAETMCGELVIEEIPTSYDESKFWWIGYEDDYVSDVEKDLKWVLKELLIHFLSYSVGQISILFVSRR